MNASGFLPHSRCLDLRRLRVDDRDDRQLGGLGGEGDLRGGGDLCGKGKGGIGNCSSIP